MLRQLKIDPEFQSKIPPLTFEELNLLETNILEEGRILSPLIVWNDLIVDGHNRFAILKNHPEIKYTVLEKEFANRYEAIVWICKNQLGRRNLTLEQKKYLMGKQYEAEKNVSYNRGNQYTSLEKSGCSQFGNSQNRRTCSRIAKENGVSKNTVLRSETFAKEVDLADEAVPGTRAKILSGEVKPTAAELTAVSRATPEERPALVAELCKPKERKTAGRNGRKEKKASPQMKTAASDASSLESDEQIALLPESSPAPPSKPAAPAPVKIDNKQLLEIAASRYHAKRRATGSDMLCEIEVAADNLKQRWEQTFQYYPDLFTEPDNRAAVAKIAQSLMDYLKEVEERTE